MDETGFRTGVERDQFIVTERKRALYLGIPENLSLSLRQEIICLRS